jgi:erythromycin esterase
VGCWGENPGEASIITMRVKRFKVRVKTLKIIFTALCIAFCAWFLQTISLGDDEHPDETGLNDGFFLIEPGLKGRHMSSLFDLDDLIMGMAGSKYVLLGESTHGTREYYEIRSHITKELIGKHEFDFVVLEGDWAAVYELNKYVKGLDGAEDTGGDAMESLDRWPVWMWKNEVILDLVEWIRQYNDGLPPERKVGVYGMDVYGTLGSYEGLGGFFDGDSMRELDDCLKRFDYDFGAYPHHIRHTGMDCAQEIENFIGIIDWKGLEGKDEFLARQKLEVLRNAEMHYRFGMFTGYDSWNARASHFAGTVERVTGHYGGNARGIVWAHNTHVGDSNFVIGADEMLNIGAILRDDAFILGFVKNTGRVSAGTSWGSPMRVMDIPNARPGSYGHLFAQQELDRALIIFGEDRGGPAVRGHRAIGVVYNPNAESGNYVPTNISYRYDAIIFLNNTGELYSI